MNPLFLLGAAAVLVMAAGKKTGRKAIVCPPMAPGGGQLAGYNYIEFTTGGAAYDEQLPLIVFFHCLGCEPQSMVKYLADLPVAARVVMPYGREQFGGEPAWWTLRAKTEDQAGLAAQMDAASGDMACFVEMAAHCFNTRGRPIIVGHSQGAMMTFAVAAKRPNLIKAAIPASGWLPENLWATSMPPTYAVHGMKDRTVNFSRTEDFVNRSQQAGHPIEWYPIEGKGHGLSGDLLGTWLRIIEWAARTDF